MSKYCVDLETAKELKKNGFPQKGEWGYFNIAPEGHEDHIILCNHGADSMVVAFAPTSDEILEQLPLYIKNRYGVDQKYSMRIMLYPDYYQVTYGFETYDGWFVPYQNPMEEICDLQLVNALAKMWLYLKKEGYIE